MDPTFNVRHSNSEGLPDIERDANSNLEQGKITAKDKDHFDFLNSLRKNLNVD